MVKRPHCERPIDRPICNEVLSGGSPVLILSCPACDKIVGPYQASPRLIKQSAALAFWGDAGPCS